MRTKLPIFLVFIVILIAVGSAGLVVWKDIKNDSEQEPAAIATGTPSVIIEPVGSVASDVSSNPPGLDRPIKVLAALPENTAIKAVARIGELTAELRKDNTLFSSWLELAINRKLIGDNEAAEEILLYVTQNWPDDPVAYSNLADYYLMVARDNERAETYLLLAIAKVPTNVIFYENAYSFYRFVKKDLTKAQQILEEGIAKNQTNDAGLKKLLADLKAGA